MNELDIIEGLRNVVVTTAALPDTSVRTKGGDETQTFPRVILDFNARRSRDNGANPHAGLNYDSQGNLVSEEKHHYFAATVDFEFKSEDEEEVWELGNSVQRAFMHYEDSPNDFDPDTYLWEAGEIAPQRNPVMEPDWYEVTTRVRFRFLKVVTDTDVATLDDIQHNINSN